MPAAIVRSAATLGLERAMLVSLALVLSIAACQEPDQATGPSLNQAALPKSITLTYICGNSFRVRNTNPSEITVTWDVYQQGETGTLLLPPKPASAPYSETYFTTVKKGTVRLFLDGVLIQTKANGNKPACQLPVDTTKPAIPASGLFDLLPESTFVASPPGDSVTVYYRNVFAIRFDDSTSGTTIRNLLQSMHGEIIAGAAGAKEYKVRFPDPGPTYQAVDSLGAAIISWPGVKYAVPVLRQTGAGVYSRRPVDGLGGSRHDWLGSGTDFTRSRLQVRAPLAWGCETGTYGATKPRVGVVDFQINPTLPNFEDQLVTTIEPTAATFRMKPSTRLGDPVIHSHGTSVSAILLGNGDDSAAAPGMVWGADFTFLALSNGSQEPEDMVEYFVTKLLPEATKRGIRVLVSSVVIGPSQPQQVLRIQEAIKTYVDSGGLFIQAVGNFSGIRTPEQLLAIQGSSEIANAQAMARLFQSSPQSRSGLIFVGGTRENGKFWEEGSYLRGMTEMLAPATRIATLAFDGHLQTDSGTSLSAPFVGGVAAQLLAMDPSLTAAELKEYVIRGAAVSREDPATGDSVVTQAVEHVPNGESVHQLDAYGSLKLLSYERPGTPLCGLTITNTGNAWYQTQSIIQRQGGPEQVSVGGQPVAFTSIAQGGRLAAAGIDQYRLSGGEWVGAGSTSGDAIVFLEQDTAYLRPVESNGPLWIRTDLQVRIGSSSSSRRVGPTNITEAFPANLAGAQYFWASAWYTPELVSVSPTGDWVYLEYIWSFNDDCLSRPSEGEEFRVLIPLRGGQGREFSRRTYSDGCGGPGSAVVTATPAAGGRIAWSGDGREFYYAREYYDANTRLERWSTANGVSQVGSGQDAGPLTFDALVWSQEGGRLLSRERTLWYVPYSEQACYNRVRASGSAGVIASSVAEGNYENICPDVPLAAARLASALGLNWAPGTTVRPTINRRYPLGIPRSMRAN